MLHGSAGLQLVLDVLGNSVTETSYCCWVILFIMFFFVCTIITLDDGCDNEVYRFYVLKSLLFWLDWLVDLFFVATLWWFLACGIWRFVVWALSSTGWHALKLVLYCAFGFKVTVGWSI